MLVWDWREKAHDVYMRFLLGTELKAGAVLEKCRARGVVLVAIRMTMREERAMGREKPMFSGQLGTWRSWTWRWRGSCCGRKRHAEGSAGCRDVGEVGVISIASISPADLGSLRSCQASILLRPLKKCVRIHASVDVPGSGNVVSRTHLLTVSERSTRFYTRAND